MAAEPVAVAVLAKAPVAGFAKTRLIPALGAGGAAALQVRLTERAVATACASGIGPVTLWCTPDESHASFRALRSRFAISLARQCDGDLGARMLAPIAAAKGPALIIGTDAPALTAAHLRKGADVLSNVDVVVFPAEDGGYALIGMRNAQATLFTDMPWGTADVMEETRRRLRRLGLIWQEPVTLWDVDVPADLDRLRASDLGELLS